MSIRSSGVPAVRVSPPRQLHWVRGDSVSRAALKGTAVMTPDKQAAIDEYVKKCRPRGSTHATKEKEYWVVVLRPVTEPPPEGYRYKEEDVVFEIEKGPEPMQLSFGRPSGSILFEKLPEEEKKNTLHIDCHFACPAASIRKQLRQSAR
jgi:hypothetical protein